MVFCEGDMSAKIELMQPELFGQDEPPCPGYDVCPIGICGCRFLGLGTPFASDVKKPDNAREGIAEEITN
jgi:hypothetical protein